MSSTRTSQNAGRKTVTLRLDKISAKKLRILATVKGQTVNQILRELVEGHLRLYQHQLSGFPLWPKIDDV